MFHFILLKWPSWLNTVKYWVTLTNTQKNHFTRSANLWSSRIDHSIITVLFKAQAYISLADSFKGCGRFWLLSWQDTKCTSCCVCQHLPGQRDKPAVMTRRSLIPHYSQIHMQTKLGDWTECGRLWLVRGQYEHQRTGILSFFSTYFQNYLEILLKYIFLSI